MKIFFSFRRGDEVGYFFFLDEMKPQRRYIFVKDAPESSLSPRRRNDNKILS